MKVFGFNILSIITLLLPKAMRGENVLALFSALTEYFENGMESFTEFQKQLNRQMKYNAQKLYFERGLNDIFNPGHNGIFDHINNNIYITQADQTPNFFLFNQSEVSFQDTFLENDGEALVEEMFLFPNDAFPNLVHYYINVPSSLTYNNDELIGFVEKYNPIGKIYEIMTY